jgi:hypothetical protein
VRKTWPSPLSAYYIVFLALSAVGMPLYGYPYCFHLLHFAVGNEMLNRVFTAISSARGQLVWVALLLAIIMFNYTLLAFAFLRNTFNQKSGMPMFILRSTHI